MMSLRRGGQSVQILSGPLLSQSSNHRNLKRSLHPFDTFTWRNIDSVSHMNATVSCWTDRGLPPNCLLNLVLVTDVYLRSRSWILPSNRKPLGSCFSFLGWYMPWWGIYQNFPWPDKLYLMSWELPWSKHSSGGTLSAWPFSIKFSMKVV